MATTRSSEIVITMKIVIGLGYNEENIMPDYTVTVTKVRVVKEDVPVTAANQAAAEAAALAEWTTYVLDKNENVTFEAVATVVP